MTRVAAARWLVPVVAVADRGRRAGAHVVETRSDMAAVTLTSPDGSRALPMFTALEASPPGTPPRGPCRCRRRPLPRPRSPRSATSSSSTSRRRTRPCCAPACSGPWPSNGLGAQPPRRPRGRAVRAAVADEPVVERPSGRGRRTRRRRGAARRARSSAGARRRRGRSDRHPDRGAHRDRWRDPCEDRCADLRARGGALSTTPPTRKVPPVDPPPRQPTCPPRRAHCPSGPLGFIVDPALDAQRRRDLRRMRLVATGLLVFAAIVYVLTRGHDEGWLGYVNAGAEASMVGACADWFAVTALFRHPLGLPIPHTALIPRKKEMIGRSLEEFVGENFLHEEIIRERVLDAEPTRRAAEWVLEPTATPSGSSTRWPRSAPTPCTGSPTGHPGRHRAGRAAPAHPGAGELAGRRAARPGRARRAHVGLVDLDARRDARAGSSTTRTSSSRSSPSGRRRGCRTPSTTSSPARSTSRRSSGSPTSAGTPRHDVRSGARQAAHRPRGRPPARPRDPGQGRAAQGAGALAPAGRRHGDVAVAVLPGGRHRRAGGRGGSRSARAPSSRR